jgi:parallel beta-helix repeat protein
MAVFLSQFAGAGQQFFTNAGVPLAGGLIYSYGAGGTTPLATYTTSAGNIQHSNPIQLDAAGRVPGGGEIWLTSDLAYKFIIKDSALATIQTLDNVGGSVDGASLAASSGSSLVGFIQAGAGAVARTAQSKMRDIVHVKDFGAVGNGVADDTAAIQSACSAAKTVIFGSSADSYKISAAITIASGATLLINGATITQTTDQTPIFNASNTDNVTVTGGRFVGKSEASYNNTPSSQAICIKADSCTDLLVTQNRFENFWYSPLMVTTGGNRIEFSSNTVKGPGAAVLGANINYRNTTGVTIIGDNLRIANNEIYETAQGIIVGQGSSNIVIDGNLIHDLINEHGIYADTGMRRLTISNNVIRTTGTNGSGLKVQCYDSFGVQPQCIVISGNAISNTGADAILIDNTTASPSLLTVGVTISSNTIQNAGAYGISVKDSQDVVVVGNEISVAGSSGIAWANINSILISDNYVRGSALTGMRDLDVSANVIIKNNVVRNCATANTGSDEYGILIGSGGASHLIDGNVISDSLANMQYGIYVIPNYNSTLSIIDNTVLQSTDTGLRLGSTDALLQYRRNNFNGTIAATFNDPVLSVVASAATITIPTAYDVVSISGTTGINTITANGHSGRRVTLFFQDALTVTDGSNLFLSGNFVTTANDTLTLVCNGTNWYEVSRSIN